jgi:peptidoglycan/LPS O-acetylase OafA/YrhL
MLILGEASYSIYLVHWGCLWRLDTLARDHGAAWPSWMSAGWTLFAATLIVSTIAGIALHFIVERPCRRWVRHRLGYA